MLATSRSSLDELKAMHELLSVFEAIGNAKGAFKIGLGAFTKTMNTEVV